MNKIQYIIYTLLIVTACASIGSPDGGPYDELPPRVVATSPADRSVQIDKVHKVRIRFNEYVKLENASEKVVVSPPQSEQPDLYTVGKSVVMTLYDTLQPNTTYTIDFNDAIVDNNEGNPLGKYTYSFSTGTEIDTSEVSGVVLAAENLEPVKGILVGLYNIDGQEQTDTLLTNRQLERVARTNGDGQFTIKGISAAGRYRIHALNDMDGNYRFTQKSEMLSFDTLTFTPWCHRDMRHDTVWTDSTHYERILHVPYMRHRPDDLVLRAFLEDGQAHYLLKIQRTEPLKFTAYFTAPSDTLPLIEITNPGDWSHALLPQPNLTNDTITYWITDTLLAYTDTLHMHLSYLETDTLGDLVPRTDTLQLVPRTLRSKQLKDLEERVAKWHKSQVKYLERYEKKLAKFQEKHPDSIYPYPEEIDTVRSHCPYYQTDVTLTVSPGGEMSPDKNLRLTCNFPIDSLLLDRIHFMQKIDSLEVDAPYVIERDTLDPCVLHMYAEWRPGQHYKVAIDTLAISTVYGDWLKPMQRDVSIAKLDDFGTLFVQLRLRPDDLLPTDSTATPQVMVQLLDKGDKVIRQVVADRDGRANFFFLSPGMVYLRCYIDSNGDGKWTTGDYASGRQPEMVYYYPRPFNIRAKWDLDQTWDIHSVDPLKQKPAELIKQKEKTKNRTTAVERNRKRREEGRF